MDGPTDPRAVQRRLAATPSGREVWVEISGDDRLRLIKALPHRWPEVVMARERGESFKAIHDRFASRLSCSHGWTTANGTIEADGPCELADHLGGIYAWLETAVHDLARDRAKLMI